MIDLAFAVIVWSVWGALFIWGTIAMYLSTTRDEEFQRQMEEWDLLAPFRYLWNRLRGRDK